MKIGFYGTRGAYSEAAAAAVFFNEDIATYPYISYPTLFEALEKDTVDLIVVPFNSSRVGVIPEVMHFMRERNVCLNYQIKISTAFGLSGARGASETDVKRVFADPLAMVFCSQYLKGRPELTLTPSFDMPKTFEELAKSPNPEHATLCGKFAASIYNLSVLKENCNDDPNGFMVYAGFGKEPRVPAHETKKGKPLTMVVLDLAHEPGSLMHSLEAFATEDINLLTMELRPTDPGHDRVSFFMTFEGVYTDENVKAVLRKLESVTDYVRCVGSYVPQFAQY